MNQIEENRCQVCNRMGSFISQFFLTTCLHKTIKPSHNQIIRKPQETATPLRNRPETAIFNWTAVYHPLGNQKNKFTKIFLHLLACAVFQTNRLFGIVVCEWARCVHFQMIQFC